MEHNHNKCNTQGNRNQNRVPEKEPETFLSENPFCKEWITVGADEKMVDFANAAGEYMKNYGLTNSKIRGVYGEIKRIQMGNFNENRASFCLLKPKMAYAVGRETDKNTGKCKIKGLKLFQLIFDKCFGWVHSPKEYNNFCNLMEAILAYHKYHGGKEN